MKKLLIVVGLAAVGYFVYRQVAANKAEEDLWEEANAPEDLTAPLVDTVQDVGESDSAPEEIK